ncbi:hypothetical protein [Sporomusa malonica]|uniref:Uncharacterized protein n=1 Tax=Sporomusa malonica TaxID=112901 RepID=A0A1W2C5D0_9FIRM|nr:hypothetical protein [Sporomusa malonica]SMC80419.1 hypothetical protein SAMN04488500_109152 [Sporomusa malonica]
MSNVKNSLASLYEKKLTSILETINSECNDYRSVLENSGFTVTCDEHPAKYEAAQNLMAAKGNVVLEVSQLLRGGKTFSVIVKDGDHERTMRLFTGRLDEAIAFADAAQYLVK